VTTRFPQSPDAAEARYATGRIQQESGRYDEAFDTYDRLARDQPRSSVASEARWRAGWVRYLGGDLPGAASYSRVADDVRQFAPGRVLGRSPRDAPDPAPRTRRPRRERHPGRTTAAWPRSAGPVA
jgi:hypothetical protein